MPVCSTIAVPPSDFLLESILTTSSFRVELERVVPINSQFNSYIWVTTPESNQFNEELTPDSFSFKTELFTNMDSGTLVKCELPSAGVPMFRIFEQSNATCLKAIGNSDGWQLTLRFPDHKHLSLYHQLCMDADLDLHISSIHDPGWTQENGFRSILTTPQRELLQTAVRMGYFEIPRKHTLEEVASELDISDTSASQRLRRGLDTLLQETIV